MLQLGYAMHGESFNPNQPTAQLLRLCGRKPQRLEYARAAKMGDPWVLGLSPTMPAWAAKIQKEAGPVVDPYAFLREDPAEALEELVDPTASGGKTAKMRKASAAA